MLLLKQIAQLLKQIRDVGISIILQTKPALNHIVMRIDKQHLTTYAKCVEARLVSLLCSYAAGIVPAVVVAFVIGVIHCAGLPLLLGRVQPEKIVVFRF